MNPLFKQLYKHKKTRVRDPNAPPPPTLLGQVKELKDTRQAIDENSERLSRLESKVARLESKNRYLENYVDSLRRVIQTLQRK
jgi:predicted RNase H-like nuclease (RuvC/YqgF family)